MGHRTTVILNNDQCSDWEKDPLLGSKISHAMNFVNSPRYGQSGRIEYGNVIECAHTSTNTLGIITGFHMDTYALRTRHFYEGAATEEKLAIDMLKEMAEKLGYRIIKKSKK